MLILLQLIKRWQFNKKVIKRKDPEAAVSYYHEMGIPVDAAMTYVATITNSNFEAWYDCNKDKSLDDFDLTLIKLVKVVHYLMLKN